METTPPTRRVTWVAAYGLPHRMGGMRTCGRLREAVVSAE